MQENERKNSKKQLILRIVITLLIIHLFLILSRCTVETTNTVSERVPITEEINETDIVKECEDRDYSWSYTWEGWIPEQENKIAAQFRLTNNEPRKGIFSVGFAYFDTEEHNFKDYEGKNYEEVRDELPWDDAAMTVDRVTRTVDAFESVVYVPAVRKKNPDRTYWAYADVFPPSYRYCQDTLETVKRNQTRITVVERESTTTESISLWDLLVRKFLIR